MVVDKFKITYDEVGRMGIDIHQLYSIFEANTELSFDEWWEYMKSSHLAENEDFINEWVTLEAAKDICQYEILRLAEEHDFADPIFFCYITEEMLSASEYAEKAAMSNSFVNNIGIGIMKFLKEVRGENNG